VDEVDAHPLVQRLEVELRHAADAEARVIERARLRLGERHQLREGLHIERRIHHQHVRSVRRDADVAEVLQRIVRQLRIQARVHAERATIGDQDRVAIGHCLGDGVGPERAIGARLVVDDDRLAERLAHLLRERARRQVGAAAGGKGTTSLIGRFGYGAVCATAPLMPSSVATKVTTNANVGRYDGRARMPQR
jgi:hypothetical protein